MSPTRKRGFTLIEAVIAIAVAGIVVSVLAVVINSGLHAWFFIKGQRNYLAESRGAVKRMTREMRGIKNNSDGIIVFTSSRFQFKDASENTIEYRQNGTNLERNSVVLLENLANPGGLAFNYLTASGGVAATKEAIRTIQIELAVSSGNNQVRLKGAAGIRNR